MLAAAIQYSKNENQLKAMANEKLLSVAKGNEWAVFRTHIVAIDTVLDEEDTETTGADERQKEKPSFEKVGSLFSLFPAELCHFE